MSAGGVVDGSQFIDCTSLPTLLIAFSTGAGQSRMAAIISVLVKTVRTSDITVSRLDSPASNPPNRLGYDLQAGVTSYIRR